MPGSHAWRAALLAALVVTILAAAASPPGAASAPRPRVVVVLDRGGCPPADTLQVCEGFVRAMRETGVRGRIVSPTYREHLSDFLGLVARQRYELVIIWGLFYDPAVSAAARRHPDAHFAVLDASRTAVSGTPRNVQGVVFRTSEAAYLAGWLAGKLERRRPGRDVVGAVGGIKIPAVEDFVVGFVAGARRAAPGIEVLVDYSNDFVDPTKCTALARRQIARGAGTIFNVAGGCGLGTMRAAAEAGVWAVGVDTDQAFLGPHVLTSVRKDFGAGFLALLRQVKVGRVRSGGDTILTMRDGAVGLGTISPKVPRALVAQLAELRRRIVAGKIVVPGVVPRRGAE